MCMWNRTDRITGLLIALVYSCAAWAQCDPTVPVLTTDLSASPSATWTSPLIARQGLCCGTSAPAQCIKFIITLHPDAQGIVFDVCAGAVPSGAMFYQIDCGPPTAVGTPLCLSGVGPFILTFCKPGNNINAYCITSIAEPTAGPDIAVNDGCQGTITTNGFAPGTIQWSSIAPGSAGAYDNYLGCPTCANTVVTAQPGYPAYVDYRVCGNAVSPCSNMIFCDTVRVWFNSTLAGTILPQLPTVCYGAAGTTITVNGSGGTPPYSYLWNTGATTASIFVGPGTYTVQVSDTTQCPPTSTSVTVTQFQQPIEALAGADILVCGGTGPAPVPLNANVTGASGGQWTGGSGSFQPNANVVNATYTPTLAEIASGSVQLLLTTTGNGTCPGDTDDLTIAFAAPFANMGLLTTDATCSGSANGNITVAPTLPGWTYSWAHAPQLNSAIASGLGAGTYSVTVMDPSGCDTTLTAIIIAPQPISIADVAVTPETCAGLGDGSVSVNVNGGTAPYSYAWNNSQTGPSITVGAGTWTVQVSDANGCAPATGAGTVVAEAQPNVANAGADMVACSGDLPVALSGSVINATGGTWSGGNGTFTGSGLTVQYQPTPAEILANGVDLLLTTTGNNSCAADQDTVHITLPTSFFGSSITPVNATCNGTSTGSAQFSPNAAGFTFLWNDPAAQSGATATGLGAGNYSVWVTDAYGCDTTLVTSITAPAAITIADLAVVNEQCAGTGDGSITAMVNGGTAPYSYTWSNGANTAMIQAGAGTYTLNVTDANGCAPTQGSATIQALGQPNVAQAGADLIGCYGDLPIQLTGSVTNATGGTWSGGTGTFLSSGLMVQYQPSTAEILANGVDLVLTTSGNTNCASDQDMVHITLPTSFFGSALGSTALACNEDHSGSATFTPGNSSFTYLWTDALAQATATATGLSAGTYTVHVTDNYGCDTTASVVITEPSVLSAANVTANAPSCFGGTNGSASVQPAGGTPDYTYEWSTNANGQTTSTAVGLPSGAYTVVVTDANGCQAQATAITPSLSPIAFTAQVDDTVCVNTPVPLTAQASGGAGGYTITWAGIGTGNSLQYSFPATQVVQVSVVDQAGCIGPLLELPVTVLDLSLATLHTYGDTAVCPGGSATVGAWLTGYPGATSLSWPQLPAIGNGPFNLQATSSRTLTVIATDACSNSLQATIAITVETPPVITLPPVIAEGCAPLTAHFPSGLTNQSVSYFWSFGDGSTSTSMAPVHVYSAGNYTVSLTVTTPLGCSAAALTTGSVHAYANLVASFTANPWETDADHADVQFTDQSTGAISTWAWSFGDGGSSIDPDPEHHYLDPGTWQVSLQVTDDHGCTSSVDHIVTVVPVYDITIPNAFTPNGSGGNGGGFDPMDLSNDVFYPFIRFVKDFRMRLFNRWGELVFESNDIKQGWDGYYKGHPSQQDVYVYQVWVRFVDNKEAQRIGDVTLFR